jgi:hypothetical protein
MHPVEHLARIAAALRLDGRFSLHQWPSNAIRTIEGRSMRDLSRGQILFIVVLVALLIVTGYWAVSVWNATSDVAIDKHGWIPLILGTAFSLVIGCGLMALMFFSSRHGYDDAADPSGRGRIRPLRKEPLLRGAAPGSWSGGGWRAPGCGPISAGAWAKRRQD